MATRRRLTWLDVFTSTPPTGDGLAVVHERDGLDADTMLRVARETNLSEATFLQTATREGADYRHRTFTTAQEIPFAGHPSLGTARGPRCSRSPPGSAAGSLCAFLHRLAGVTALRVDQGLAMGRPSRIDTAMDGDRLRVGGECVVVLQGELRI
ncbi:PhzF family phenazine biosynthesis protein [Baekduia soli]|uniref:PhzF family phenazine biosynthesis protein n=1 Tax=Baekduia soli TaxID=496014 RepID=A0A5B8U1L4_9ACTN|nr:PhzF family phenazine biosynthesis protein [Baekduia soli]QEC46919.1 PhzF family phenazine biosynthesis protein [Baekduia soli]